ncbi:MAG: response regulator [Leptospiraceae bacterium]|nr:response regulator [Leptospiraceae bacterium]MCP5494514.1 response regulator [Leptospiraceae bacterium]
MDEIRKKAEELLKTKTINIQTDNNFELKKLIQELQIHQIELELQNQELLESRKSLEVSKQQYFNLFDLAPVGYIVMSVKGVIKNINLKGCEIIDKPRERVVKTPFVSYLNRSSISAFYEHLENVRETKAKQNCELQLLNISRNKIIYVELHTILFNEDSYLVSIVDITQHRKTEEDLLTSKQEAETASRLKSEFLANVSHEIRTPLNAVLGFTEILRSKLEKESPYHYYLDNIYTGGENLLRLINDILDLSKIEAGQLEIRKDAVNIKSFILVTIKIFSEKAERKGLVLESQIDEDIPSNLMLDELRLRQVVYNLLSNAIKFTHSGKITISVRRENVESKNVSLLLKIKDTGIGIPENQQKLIFEPFRQRDGQDLAQYGGTGLGLTISKKLVELMGGTITLESKVNQGSMFIVKLENIEVDQKVQNYLLHNLVKPTQIRFIESKILVVEDIESNRSLVKEYLEGQNITIVEAENGEEAIDKMKEILPDLILMDLRMPIMDGDQAIEIIKADKNLKDIPIIVLTASTTKTEKQGDFFAKVDAILLKPFTKNQLIEAMMKFLPYTQK